MAAVGAALSASLAAGLAEVVATGRLLLIQLIVGGAACAAMALARSPVELLALGVQIGTAASPLLTGALAAVSLGSVYLMDGALAWVGAAMLLVLARDLLTRRVPRGI